MATNVKLLASVTLASTSPTSPTLIYTPTGTKSALVTGVTVINVGAAAVDVFLTTGSGTTPPVIFKATNLVNGGNSATMTDVVTLAGADQIKGYTSAAQSVQCSVYGIERD